MRGRGLKLVASAALIIGLVSLPMRGRGLKQEQWAAKEGK